MKRLNQIMCMVVLAMAVLTVSCTKEGPQGPPGSDGTNGNDGNNGVDGTAGCVTCHTNDTELALKTAQFETSKHFVGGQNHVGYGDYHGSGCSMCHTHEGFTHAIENDVDDGGLHTAATAMSCYTCHQIHTSYTLDDYAMNFTDPVKLMMNAGDAFDGLEVDVTSTYGDPEGKGNTCVKCHQSRNEDGNLPNLDLTTPLIVQSPYYGPHYGSQGIVFGGKGGYFAAEAGNGKHTCISCHINNAQRTDNNGVYFGGHNMSLSAMVTDPYGGGEEYVAFTAACTECHVGELTDDFDLRGIQSGVKSKLETLRVALEGAGIMTETGRIVTGVEHTQAEVAAFWNYKLVKDDGSYGIHNKTYANDLLDGALGALQ